MMVLFDGSDLLHYLLFLFFSLSSWDYIMDGSRGMLLSI